MKSRFFVPTLLVLILVALFTAQACGPDFFPDIFVLRLRPDHPKEFAAGKLGVLLPTYPRADLMVAFRYLNGGGLASEEQRAYQPTYAMSDPEWEKQWNADNAASKPENDPVQIWKKLRDHYAGPAPAVQPQRTDATPQPGGFIEQTSYDNCNVDAFRTAALTLEARAKTWGEKNADLADWIKGQDTVFNNCSAHPPMQLPADAPLAASALLKADRAYQQAAARFYAASYVDARKDFEAIAQNQSSPWHSIAPYLAARCLVRQAFAGGQASGGASIATFDAEIMQQAADLLQSLLQQNIPGAPRHAIQNELDLVRLRTEPLVRARELASALAGPKTDPNYDQHLRDLNWYLNAQLDEAAVRADFNDFDSLQPRPDFGKAYLDFAKLRAAAPLVDWLVTFQSPAKQAKDHAVSEWKSTHQLPWLLAAITKATEKDAEAADLVTAAADIKPDSAAWESLTYHRIRLLIAIGHAQEARTLLDQSLPQVRASGRDSSVNAWLGLRMRASESLNEFLTFAPRKVIATVSESQSSLNECVDVMKDPRRNYDCTKKSDPVQFSGDAAAFFNNQAPLATLIDSANSSSLPRQLRNSLAIMGWVRAVLLKDDVSAAKLFPLLPQKLQTQAGSGTGFHTLMTIMRNPGLRPYLDPGVQRSYSYDFVESYADNWWCKDWKSNYDSGNVDAEQLQPIALLTPALRAEGESQVNRLLSQKGAAIDLGGLVLAYANAHPDDPDVPEALYLMLRMIRYGCERASTQDDAAPGEEPKKVDDLRKAAARLLRQRYTTNPWTKKAAPYAG
jgi:uncharacterized protein (UPF0147 family)